MLAEVDLDVRAAVYEAVLQNGVVPRRARVAASLERDEVAIAASFEQLTAARMLVAARGELLMAPPFSATPTPFFVDSGDWTAWGNCAWDALGVVAMANRDAVIRASCGCCGEPATLRIENQTLLDVDAGLVHFALPPKQWWNDVVFT